ncbi:MAG: sensor domain-containing diguanylate cyclase [Shinella sp.]|nr:sensor domain-containing diguanylate cyclase [Shinella sp.]
MGQNVLLPANETERLLAVRSLGSIGTSATPELGALAELAQGVFDAPLAAVNIIDEDWQRIAGRSGMAVSECPRNVSICTRVVYANDVVIIPDMAAHPELSSMPYVTGEPRFRFYAGAPVELEPEMVVGAFCILDTKPRNLSQPEIQSLTRFALVAGGLLRLHKANLVMGLAQQSLRTAAMTDPLTGFYNRTALTTLVDIELEAALAANLSLGVLYLDMDGFKGINDRFGHHAGDEVLREAAERIRSIVRPDDIIVRMGGDEFAVFIPDPPHAVALESVAERLVTTFRAPFQVDNGSVNARLSVGGAIAPRNGRHRSELLKAVDAALYKAKEAGRDRFHVVTD